MLQQTQVSAVIPYYQRFLAGVFNRESPRLARRRRCCSYGEALATTLVGAISQGCCRNSKKWLPQERRADRGACPASGRSDRAAIAVFAFGERAAILAEIASGYWPACFGTEEDLWALAERLLPKRGIATYTQALIGSRATVCSETGTAARVRPRRAAWRGKPAHRRAAAARPRKALPLKENDLVRLPGSRPGAARAPAVTWHLGRSVVFSRD